MLLDKIADDWSSVSSGKLQHFGVLAPMTKTEKFALPYRNSPVRTIGETEGRIFSGYCGREAIAEMMDRSNSPNTQRAVVWNILNSQNPTNIDKIVDSYNLDIFTGNCNTEYKTANTTKTVNTYFNFRHSCESFNY